MTKTLFDKINNEDTIYHYTKAATAIDYILFNQELRFSRALNSSDPIENKSVKRSTAYFGSETNVSQTKQHHDEVNELHKFVNDLENRFHQICFCKNSIENDSFIRQLEGNEELFGFTKLRMWDQYADNFSGVCIAFSKEKILSLNKEKFDLIIADIEYLKFQYLPTVKIGDIYGNHLIKVGFGKYREQLKEQLLKSLFCKHIDYSGENELRFGTFHEDNKCSMDIIRGEFVFNQSMMLDIKDCIQAIFVSSFANKKQKEDLLNYAKKMNVDLFEMKWQHDSFELLDCKKEEEFWKGFNLSK